MDSDVAARLGTNIGQLREVRGLTQQQMAKLAGVPRATWAHLESGNANPTLSVLHRAAAALQVTMEELISMTRAVVAGTRTALVVADLPFGSYQSGPDAALANAVRHLKEGGAQAVKLEGGRRVLPQVRALTAAGIPVMGHLGLTPQSVNTLGGMTRVQGRGEAGDQLLADARALERAGAFAVVLESVPADLGRKASAALRIPTVGIGAGPDCDAQILVWQDMAGLTEGRLPRFVRQYASTAESLLSAASQYVADVAARRYPDEAHSYA